MFIRRVQVSQTRNLQEIALDDFSTLNFFVGDNGAGKTSLLEAIAIASQGRSFRSNKVQTVINREHTALSVFVELLDDHGNLHKLGVERDRKNAFNIRINGANIHSLAEMSQLLPVLVLDSNAFDLLDGSPTVRRRFLDWGVFHVEHRFHHAWKSFNRALKQRNMMLRKGMEDYDLYRPWDRQIAEHSVTIEQYRLEYIRRFQAELEQVMPKLDAELADHKVFYRSGWPAERTDISDIESIADELAYKTLILSHLQETFARDLQYQRSHIGPHRADIEIKLGRNTVKDIYSRGQKKTLVAAMKLAQATVLAKSAKKLPVLLLDDLPSELDSSHLKAFIGYVIAQGYQCFITSVNEQIYHDNTHAKARMFHVERGKITPAIGDDHASSKE